MYTPRWEATAAAAAAAAAIAVAVLAVSDLGQSDVLIHPRSRLIKRRRKKLDQYIVCRFTACLVLYFLFSKGPRRVFRYLFPP